MMLHRPDIFEVQADTDEMFLSSTFPAESSYLYLSTSPFHMHDYQYKRDKLCLEITSKPRHEHMPDTSRLL